MSPIFLRSDSPFSVPQPFLARAAGRHDNPRVSTPRAARILIGLALFMSCGGSGSHGGGDDGGAGAGGSDGGGTCGAVSACGGDLVGLWLVTQSCLISTEDLSSVCAGASASIDFAFSGTSMYGADHSYTSTTTGGGTTHYHYPSACLPSGKTCTEFGQLLMPVGGYSSITCTTDNTGVCNCDGVTPSTSGSETGTYSTAGGTLTTTHAGTTSSIPYCVSGNVMNQMPALTTTDGGTAQVTGSVVLVRY
jgi:hypothetical protein